MKKFVKDFLLIPLLIYFYNYIILTAFGMLGIFGFLPSIALFFSFIPIFSIYIFYKYFLKNHLSKNWIRFLVCLGFYLIPFCVLLSLVFLNIQNDKIQVQLLSKEIKNAYSVSENNLDKLESINILTLKGLLAGIFISMGGIFLSLEDWLKPIKNQIIQSKPKLKKFFFWLLIVSFFLFTISQIFLTGNPNIEKEKFSIFIYFMLMNIGGLILSYSASFILSLLVLSLFYLFQKKLFFEIFN